MDTIQDSLKHLLESTNTSNSKYKFYSFGHADETLSDIHCTHPQNEPSADSLRRKQLVDCINETFKHVAYKPSVVMGECYAYGLLEAGRPKWKNIYIKTVATKRGQCSLTWQKYPVSLIQFILEYELSYELAWKTDNNKTT